MHRSGYKTEPSPYTELSVQLSTSLHTSFYGLCDRSKPSLSNPRSRSEMDRQRGDDNSYLDMVEGEVHDSPVKNFFTGSTIFVTGATGFMGKILIEKLLRTCPDLKKIIILARAKKGKTIAKRFEEQFADPVYQKLKTEHPNFFSKLSFVAGDVGMIRLGMNEADFETVCSETNIIFHSAATVRFDERIQTAVRVNVRGTREVMLLARRTPNLKSMLHVSTAFSNCVQRDIKEKFYDPPIPADKLIELVESLDENSLDKITSTLLGDFPNTYTFTKIGAENVVKEMSKGLPVALIRPSIIIPTAKEPIPGWIDSYNGPTAVYLTATLGLMHSIHCNPKAIADLIPVDYIVNACLVVAYEIGRIHDVTNKGLLAINEQNSDYTGKVVDREVPIYNYVSSNQKPITWGKYVRCNEKHVNEIPTMFAMWCYSFRLTENYYLHKLITILTHSLPAYTFDAVLYCIGKKPRLVKTYEKIDKVSALVEYFCTQTWHFETNNIENLYKNISPRDRALFYFNIANLNWDEYFYTHLRGLRVYLLKDPLETVDRAKQRQKLFRVANFVILSLVILGLLRMLYSLGNGK